MNLCPKASPSRRTLVVLCVLVASYLARAEHIQFSKPVVPIATPAKEQEKLSRDRSKGRDFGEPATEQSFVSQPQIIRIRPRELEEDAEESDPREPRDLTDPSERHLVQDSARKASARERTARNQPRLPGSKRLDDSQSEDSQSLSPVTDFDLNEREPGQLSSNPLFAHRSSTNRNTGRHRGSSASREDSERQQEGFRPLAFFDMAGARAQEKEKPTREVLERRAAFEQLLNPNAGMASKTPGSFEPVTALDPLKPVVPMKTPVMGGGKMEAKPVQPLPSFGAPPSRLQPPVFGGMNKTSTKPAPAAGPSIDPFRQTPLNRQPGVHEFPARKF